MADALHQALLAPRCHALLLLLHRLRMRVVDLEAVDHCTVPPRGAHKGHDLRIPELPIEVEPMLGRGDSKCDRSKGPVDLGWKPGRSPESIEVQVCKLLLVVLLADCNTARERTTVESAAPQMPRDVSKGRV